MKKEYAETSLVDCCRHFAELTQGIIKSSENEVSFIPAFNGFTWYNRTFITGEFTENPGTIIACISDYNKTKDIVHKLKEFGYQKMIDQAGMVMDLTDFECITEKDIPEGITIERIGSADIQEWIKCNSEGFGKGPEDIYNQIADVPDLYYYACRKDGKIIGTTLLYTDNENAGIHEVSMLPEYRGNGYAKALLKTALSQGKQMGAKAASLQASALGEPLYKSIGFETVSIITNYINGPIL